MSALIYLTQAPTKIGLAGSRQMIQNAVDVSAYRHISLLLEVLAYVGAPGNFEVTVITGMQLDTDDGWIELGTFGSQSTDGQWKVDLTDALRYIRWEVKAITGSSPTITFVISGVARE
jgi:hypothetical protein